MSDTFSGVSIAMANLSSYSEIAKAQGIDDLGLCYANSLARSTSKKFEDPYEIGAHVALIVVFSIPSIGHFPFGNLKDGNERNLAMLQDSLSRKVGERFEKARRLHESCQTEHVGESVTPRRGTATVHMDVDIEGSDLCSAVYGDQHAAPHGRRKPETPVASHPSP